MSRNKSEIRVDDLISDAVDKLVSISYASRSDSRPNTSAEVRKTLTALVRAIEPAGIECKVNVRSYVVGVATIEVEVPSIEPFREGQRITILTGQDR